MVFAVSKVGESKLEKIKAFEQETGVTLLALNELDVEPAKIGGETLDEIKALEEELGVTLVAVN